MSGDDANRLREAEERGDAQALYDLAADLEEKGQDDLAERACLAAAKLGHPGAADSYAHYLYERDDRDEAVQWWQRAAEAGDAESAFNAGVALEELDRTDHAPGGIELVDDGLPQPEEYDVEAVRVIVEQGGASADELLPVQHWLYFGDEAAAAEAARSAGRKGFAAECVPSAGDDGRWVVRATRQMYPRPEVFARARVPLVQVAVDHGGEYDGWEAPQGPATNPAPPGR